MPTSRAEWSLFLVGFAAIASLIALNVVAWQNYSASEPPTGAEPRDTVETNVLSGAAASAKRDAGPSAAELPAESARPTLRNETPAPAATPRLADLRLRAATGDCWLEIRAGSGTGSVLYSGILAEGETLRFRRTALWIRAGAPSYLAVTVNGKPAEDFPLTTADALVTAGGVETLSLG
jgi:Domain of unknown function (DUF4115)